MKALEQRIYEDGLVLGNDILKVDSFINHQIDVKLLDQIGEYLASKFEGVTKILTIEASGIAFAVSVARSFDRCPVVFAKKAKSKITDDNNSYITSIASFTKGNVNDVSVDKRYLTSNDKVLIVDDFMAAGNAAIGLIDLCKQAGAEVKGVGIVIEKDFQGGREKIEALGIRVESAAIVSRFENGKVILKETN